jgi:16S rRNA (guanine1207-N2)-methyltransferase
MSHYFVNDEKVVSKPRTISYSFKGINFSLESDNGVFSKNDLDKGSEFLIETLLPINLGRSILDIGCGIGVIGLTLAYFTPSTNVCFTDVNTRALSLCSANAKSLKLSQRVTILQSDIYTKVEGKFDSIVSNPPIRAGKKVTYEIYNGALGHLIDGGSLYIVIRKNQGAPSVKSYLEELFGNVTLLAREKGYWVLKATKTIKSE